MDILQYESKIWATANLLRGCGIKESDTLLKIYDCTCGGNMLFGVEDRINQKFKPLKKSKGVSNEPTMVKA